MATYLHVKAREFIECFSRNALYAITCPMRKFEIPAHINRNTKNDEPYGYKQGRRNRETQGARAPLLFHKFVYNLPLFSLQSALFCL